MCGICGIIQFNQQPVQEAPILKMMRSMKHRGPDDEGVFVEKNVGLGFVRLSILDLSRAGHQPFKSEDNRYVIVLNGEVYNYIELRDILREKGYIFRSNTDTEVALKSYIEWGEECLEHFNGMWAFSIYDSKEKTVFAARDRFGIKPFYYYHDKNAFIFASDIAPLLKVRPQLAQPDDGIIFDFLLTNRTNHIANTFFKEINKLQHGHKINIKVNEGKVNINKWYSLSENKHDGYSSAEQFRDDFVSSVRLQLRSDVPLGLCLSGGLDSSSIGATISKTIGRKDIHSFSAVYGQGQKGDESEFINEFNGYIDNIHFTNPTVDSFMADMDSFISTLGEPVPGTSVYAEYKVMELAKDYCTVVLNGQGADEYMAGYHYLIGFYLKQCFLELRWLNLMNDVYQYYKIHKSVYPLQTGVFYLLPSWLKEQFMFKKLGYIQSDFYDEHSMRKGNSIFDQLYASKTLKESFLNHFEYKFEHHLLWADKTGMRFSLETRFPFIDHHLVEKMLNTDTSFIYANGVTKVILRQAMKGILPEKVRKRMDKVGYETPEDAWLRTDKFKELFYDVVNSSSFQARPYFNNEQVIRLYYQHLSGKNLGKEIWKILHLELWFRKFIDQN
jgi:asparagine synthase (glutamine-hydrolysing)